MEIVIILIICLLILLFLGIYTYVKKYSQNHKSKPKKTKKIKKPKNVVTVKNNDLSIVESYMMRKEVIFWKYLNTILPKGHIAIPKVGVNTLLIPNENKNIFNLVSDKTLDFVIFNESTMYVELVIDIYDKSLNKSKLTEQDAVLSEVLNKLKIKVISILLSTDFDKEATKQAILEKLNLNIIEK